MFRPDVELRGWVPSCESGTALMKAARPMTRPIRMWKNSMILQFKLSVDQLELILSRVCAKVGEWKSSGSLVMYTE
jgi:hypothetical protein